MKKQDPKTSHDDEAIDRFIDLLYQQASELSCHITLHDEPTTVYDSKVGGQPYYPEGSHYPHTDEGEPLRLLAQINLEDMPQLPDFPSTGMLQFYLLDALGFGGKRSGAQQVIYHATVNRELPQQKLPAGIYDAEGWSFPMSRHYCKKMHFTLQIAPFSYDDSRMVSIFERCSQQVFGEMLDLYELGQRDKAAAERIKELFELGNHRVAGYASFAQDDPRRGDDDDDEEEKPIQLLQLDSDDEMMWSDCGIAHFFLSREKLLAREFDDAFFYYDFY